MHQQRETQPQHNTPRQSRHNPTARHSTRDHNPTRPPPSETTTRDHNPQTKRPPSPRRHNHQARPNQTRRPPLPHKAPAIARALTNPQHLTHHGDHNPPATNHTTETTTPAHAKHPTRVTTTPARPISTEGTTPLALPSLRSHNPQLRAHQPLRTKPSTTTTTEDHNPSNRPPPRETTKTPQRRHHHGRPTIPSLPLKTVSTTTSLYTGRYGRRAPPTVPGNAYRRATQHRSEDPHYVTSH
nr:extensin-like [Camelus dromedarius]